jgi:succinate-acetate transporter protein
MQLTPNITARGRALRAVLGILCLAAALVLVFTVPATGWRWGAVVLLTLGGIFGIFQAAVRWCAVRAAGIKTRF